MPEVYAAHPEYAFPRNFKGYGEKGLEDLKWPNDARIAVSFVINYEEVCLSHLKLISCEVILTYSRRVVNALSCEETASPKRVSASTLLNPTSMSATTAASLSSSMARGEAGGVSSSCSTITR